MISKEEEKNYKKPKISKVWNFLIYGSTIAIGVFLIWLYSAYIFINKWNAYNYQKIKKIKYMTYMYGIAITYGVVSLLLLGGFAYITFKMTSKRWNA